MGGMYMKLDGFEFQSDSLDYGAIEDPICRYYRLGFANSSSFSEIEEEKRRQFLFLRLMAV